MQIKIKGRQTWSSRNSSLIIEDVPNLPEYVNIFIARGRSQLSIDVSKRHLLNYLQLLRG